MSLFTFSLSWSKSDFFSGESDFFSLHSKIQYFEDTNNDLTIWDMLADTMASKFIPADGPLSFGESSSTFWLKINLENEEFSSDRLLELDNPTVEYADLYIPDSTGGFKIVKSGARVLFSERGVRARNVVFRLIPEQGHKTLFLAVKSQFPLQLPLSLYTVQEFHEKENRVFLWYAVFLSITFFIIIVNLIYFFVIRDIVYLLYCGSAITIVLGVTMISGYAYMYLWPEAPEFNLYASALLVFLSVFFVNGFVRKLLLAKKYAPLADKVAHVTQYVVLALALVAVFRLLSVENINNISFLFDFISIVTITIIGIQALRAKYKPAIPYFIGFWGIAFGAGLFILGILNVIDNKLGFFIICIGSLWEMLFFMVGMGVRYRLLAQEGKINTEAFQKTIQEIQGNKTSQPKTLPENIQELSEREKDVLCLIAKGLSDKEIAEELFISITTVKTHARKIYKKLHVSNRTEAVAFANEYSLLVSTES